MTIHRRLNQATLGGNHDTWWIIKTMLDAGWTIPLSGSGSGGLYATSNVFDTAQTPKQYSLLDPNNVGIGSEPWGHPSCWAVLGDPSGNRQILLKRSPNTGDTEDDKWYFGYSPGGSFGSGQTAGVDWDATTTPAATDQRNLFGTAASPASIYANGGSAHLVHIAADDTPSPAGEYGVLALSFAPTNLNFASFIIDDLRNAPTGHPHPLALWATSQDNPWTDSVISGTSVHNAPSVVTAYGEGDAVETFEKSFYVHYRFGATIKIPGGGIVDADGSERVFSAPVGYPGPEAYMGISRWVYWAAVSARGYPDTGGGKQHLFVNEVMFKDLFDGVTTPSAI